MKEIMTIYILFAILACLSPVDPHWGCTKRKLMCRSKDFTTDLVPGPMGQDPNFALKGCRKHLRMSQEAANTYKIEPNGFKLFQIKKFCFETRHVWSVTIKYKQDRPSNSTSKQTKEIDLEKTRDWVDTCVIISGTLKWIHIKPFPTFGYEDNMLLRKLVIKACSDSDS